MSSPSRPGSPSPSHTISRYPSSSTMSSDGGYASSPHQTSYAPPSTAAPSYIPGVLPPGVDPSTVDFRTFYPYVPNEVKHRKRTTRAQLRILEDTFRCNTKPPMPLRQRLADQLDMTPRAVQVWFQNRRAKQKNLAKRRVAAEKTDDDDGTPKYESDDDDLDGAEAAGGASDPLSASTSPTGHTSHGFEHRAQTVTPPPMSGQPSSLEPLMPPRAYPIPLAPSMAMSASADPLYPYRRGSLPVGGYGAHAPALAVPAYAVQVPDQCHSPTSLPMPPALTDEAGRRRSVDVSLVRLANHPYAHVARAANGALYGPRASLASGQLAPGFAEHVAAAASVPPVGRVAPHGPGGVPAMGGLYPHAHPYANAYSGRMLAHRQSMPHGMNAMSPAASAAGPVRQSTFPTRTRLLDDRIYPAPMRHVAQPEPGPLPSPTYVFGTAAEHVAPAPELEQQLHAFQFPPPAEHHEPAYRYDQRFGSIASIAESDVSSVAYPLSDGSHGMPVVQAEELGMEARRDSVHEPWVGMGYNPDLRKDSCASVQDAFFGLNVASHTVPHHGMTEYYGHANRSADELVGLPTATQGSFDEAIALSRRGSLAQPAGGIGTIAETGLGGAWPSPPGAVSRRPSVDESALAAAYAFGYPPAAAPAPAQFSLGAAPSPGTHRSASASSDGAPAYAMPPLDAMSTYAFPDSAYALPDLSAGGAFAMMPDFSAFAPDVSAFVYPPFDGPGYPSTTTDYGAPQTVLT